MITLGLDVLFFMFLVFGVGWDLGSVDLLVLLCMENFPSFFLQILSLSPP